MRTLAIAAAVLACALGLTACTDGDGTSPSPTPTAITESASPTPAPSLTPTPSPTPSPAPTPTPLPTPSPSPTATPSPTPSPSPTAADVPDDLSTIADDGEVTLTEAQAVIDVQNQIYNDAVIELLGRPSDVSGPAGADFNAQLSRIYTQVLLGAYGDLWNQAAETQFESFNTEEPTGTSEKAVEVGEVRSDCFEVLVERNASGIAKDDVESTNRWTAMTPRDEVAASNPTGWYRNVEVTELPDTPLCDLEAS